jgi:ketosteroid isomerase-like protein
MATFERAEIEAAFEEYRRRAEEHEDVDWAAWADLFTDDAVYVEHHLGTFVGREAIRDWIVSTMAEYSAMTTWIEWHQIEGDRIGFHVWNNLPDPSGQGRPFQFPNTTVLRYAGDGRFDEQHDFYNPDSAEKVFTDWIAAGGRRNTPKDRSLRGIAGWQPDVPTPAYPRDEVERELQAYRERGNKAVATGDWDQWADQFTDDAVYLEHHYGRFEGQDAIRAWINSVMQPFPTMEFPITWHSIEGNRVTALIPNVLPDPKGGSEGYAFVVNTILHYAGNGKWSYEEDVYNQREARDVIMQWIAAGGEIPGGVIPD